MAERSSATNACSAMRRGQRESAAGHPYQRDDQANRHAVTLRATPADIAATIAGAVPISRVSACQTPNCLYASHQPRSQSRLDAHETRKTKIRDGGTATIRRAAAWRILAGSDAVLVGGLRRHDDVRPGVDGVGTRNELLMLTARSVRGVRRALVSAEMPLGSYQVSSQASSMRSARQPGRCGRRSNRGRGRSRERSRRPITHRGGYFTLSDISDSPRSHGDSRGSRPRSHCRAGDLRVGRRLTLKRLAACARF